MSLMLVRKPKDERPDEWSRPRVLEFSRLSKLWSLSGHRTCVVLVWPFTGRRHTVYDSSAPSKCTTRYDMSSAETTRSTAYGIDVSRRGENEDDSDAFVSFF